jgi:hypothetical protein
MAVLWTRINTLFLLILMLMGIAIIAMLATRAEGGPLDPQGAPGSTLPQVEPRRPIPPVGFNGTWPIFIDQSGSYFLTDRMTEATGVNGIVIAADYVSLDLNGFTLVDGSTSQYGIVVTGDHAEIRNGILQRWGIDASAATGVRISDVRILDATTGIVGGTATTIEDCTITGASGDGISVQNSVVRRCIVQGSGVTGIRAEGNTLIEDNLLLFNGTAGGPGASEMLVAGTFNYVRDNVVLTAGATTFRITGSNNHFLRNYYECGTVIGAAGNFFPAAVDLVDTNYC